MQQLLVDEWTPVAFFCENCRHLIEGYADSHGKMKTQCVQCGVTYKKHFVSSTKCTTEMFAPNGERLLCVFSRKKIKR